jgi:hypothetical protein
MLRIVSSLLVLALGFGVWAEDKKEDKEQPIKGNWVREAEGLEIGFNFKSKDQLIVTVNAGDNGVTLTCKYSADKDGKVKATVTEVKEKGEFPAKPPKGYEFKCVFKVDKETAKLTDFEGENADQARGVVEGDYKLKKGD